jgi:hypothetical protein
LEVWPLRVTIPVVILTSVAGKVIMIEGGVTLCSGVMIAESGSPELTLTGQKLIMSVVKTGIVIIVVLTTTTPFVDDQTDVVNGGQVIVNSVGRVRGGKTISQGGEQATLGVGSDHISEGTKTSPEPPEHGPDWHPVPQCAVELPQYPTEEQQSP